MGEGGEREAAVLSVARLLSRAGRCHMRGNFFWTQLMNETKKIFIRG